jgi:hypothetical protein
MKPRKFDKPDRPFTKFRKDVPPRSDASVEGERPFRKPFGHDPRAQFDDEQFTATGELADIVGTHPLDRREILRRMWRHYQDAGLVKSIGGGSPRPPRAGTDRPRYERSDRPSFERSGPPRERAPFNPKGPPRDRDDRAPRRFEGEREGAPRRYERKPEGDAPRRYGPKPEGGERRFSRDRDDRPKTYSRKPSQGPRTSTRTPSGKHPAGKRAEAISKVPRRKFKETRE